MGKVKTEQVKRVGKELMSRFPTKFTTNFEENKQTVATLTEGLTTKVRNKVAGYITHIISITQMGSQRETDEEDV